MRNLTSNRKEGEKQKNDDRENYCNELMFEKSNTNESPGTAKYDKTEENGNTTNDIQIIVTLFINDLFAAFDALGRNRRCTVVLVSFPTFASQVKILQFIQTGADETVFDVGQGVQPGEILRQTRRRQEKSPEEPRHFQDHRQHRHAHVRRSTEC